MSERITAPKILERKSQSRKIVCLTAYDVFGAQVADAADVDLVLVGDSLGNTVLGHASTTSVTLEDMVRHTRAVRAGLRRALLVADMPFGSYQASTSQAVRSAVELVRAGAEAVKLEGAYVEEISAIRRAGIPVMGHVGYTPQSINLFGGSKVQGRDAQARQVREDSEAIAEAGAFAVVLELIPAALAAEITKSIPIPTIGIGAGPDCDGEIQVFHDVLGLSERTFKHSKAFVDGRGLLQQALVQYVREVREGTFPTQDNSF